jgi:hypothetical protein
VRDGGHGGAKRGCPVIVVYRIPSRNEDSGGEGGLEAERVGHTPVMPPKFLYFIFFTCNATIYINYCRHVVFY